MPILKLPVILNLGIISQSHQEDLQKRLFKNAVEIETAKNAAGHITRNPFEITEQFIKKYNHTQGSEEQEKYVELAKQLLNRSKRRAGLKSMGEGHHVELPLAWTELLLLGLCRGKIQNDSLDTLLVSVDQAPVHADQIPVLFYLAESVLYSVCTDTSQKPNLYTSEVKMLKLGYLVFLRLFIFHVSGNLSGYQRSKSHLHTFLKALSHCESCYQQYPNILFAVHFMLRVGEIVCGVRTINNDSTQSTKTSAPILPIVYARCCGKAYVHTDAQEYDVNQVLWHCLLSWYCVQNNISQLSQVVQHLSLLRDELQQDNWVDCGLGLMVLGEAAKSSMMCLQILMNLQMGQRHESNGLQEKEMMLKKAFWPWQLEHIYCTVLADICQHSSNAQIQKIAMVGKPSSTGPGNTGGLLSLLKRSHEEDWQVRYSVVEALVRVCRGVVSQEGLRNAAWLALYKHLGQETDQRVIDATRVTEAEVSPPENHLHCKGVKSSPSPPAVCMSDQLITWRLSHTLAQLYLPPTPLQLPPYAFTYGRRRSEAATPARLRHRTQDTPTKHADDQKPRPCIKQQAYTDFKTRTEIDLMKVVEDQWQKELQIKMAEEEEVEKDEMAKRQSEEEDKFKEIMRKRLEKVKNETKPYELPGR